MLVGENPSPERPAREAELEVSGERRGGDVALEVDSDLRVRARDRPGLGIDDHVRASGFLERGQRVRGERRLARRRTAAELVEALPAARRAEDDDEHGEKCECGGEAAHGADIGRPARGPETQRGA